MCLTGLSCSRHLWQCESTLLFLFDYKIPAKILFSSYLRVCFVVQVMFLDKYDKWWSTQCFKIYQSVLNLEASKVDLTLNIISKFLTYIVHKAESFIEMQQEHTIQPLTSQYVQLLAQIFLYFTLFRATQQSPAGCAGNDPTECYQQSCLFDWVWLQISYLYHFWLMFYE